MRSKLRVIVCGVWEKCHQIWNFLNYYRLLFKVLTCNNSIPVLNWCLIFYYFHCNWKRERLSLHQCTRHMFHMSVISRTKPGQPETYLLGWVSHMGSKNPSQWVTLFCLPRCALAESQLEAEEQTLEARLL